MATKALPAVYGAPAYRAPVTVEYLRQLGHIARIGFISPDLWPSNRPDLNPVDRVLYQKRVSDVDDDLKQRLVRLRAYLNAYQVIDIASALLIHPLLKTAPNFAVNCF